MSCTLELKTLKGAKHILQNIDLETTTIEDLYGIVREFETTPDGKWKLMLIAKSVRTLRWGDKERTLDGYGTEAGRQYRLEVILDMGACHTTRKR